MGRDLVSLREFAEIMGLADTTVREYITKGRITDESIDRSVPHRPRIRVLSAKRELDQNLNKKAKARTDAQYGKVSKDLPVSPKKAKLIESITKGERKVHTSEELSTMAFNDLIKLKEAKQVELMDIKIGEASKELVRTELVYDRLFSFVQPLRDAVLNIGDRAIDAMIAAYPDRNLMLHAYRVEATDVLTRLSNLEEDVRLL